MAEDCGKGGKVGEETKVGLGAKIWPGWQALAAAHKKIVRNAPRRMRWIKFFATAHLITGSIHEHLRIDLARPGINAAKKVVGVLKAGPQQYAQGLRRADARTAE